MTIWSNDFRQIFFGKTMIRRNCISTKRRFGEMTFRENDVALLAKYGMVSEHINES